MYRFYFMLLLLPLLAKAANIIHHPCVNSYPVPRPPVPNWVWVEGCDSTGCSIPNGATRSLRTGFYPQYTHHRLEGVAKAFFMGIEFPIDQPEELAYLCDHVEGGCPLVAGSEERIGEIRLQGYSPISGVTVRVEVSVIDSDTKQVVACGGGDVTVL